MEGPRAKPRGDTVVFENSQLVCSIDNIRFLSFQTLYFFGSFVLASHMMVRSNCLMLDKYVTLRSLVVILGRHQRDLANSMGLSRIHSSPSEALLRAEGSFGACASLIEEPLILGIYSRALDGSHAT